VIDLTSPFLAAAAGDAAPFGDREQAHIPVPSKVADTGFSAVATTVWHSHCSRAD
jgi:hypothetical protein